MDYFGVIISLQNSSEVNSLFDLLGFYFLKSTSGTIVHYSL